MKKISSVLILLLSLTLYSGFLHAAVVSFPSNVSVSRDMQVTLTFRYSISNTNPGDNHTLATASVGEFKNGAVILGVINNPVSATLSDSGSGIFNGMTSETVILSSAVIKKAEKLGLNTFQFERTFTLSGGAVPSYDLMAVVNVTVRTQAGADFRVTRCRLYFENKKGEITVKRRQEALRVYADIRFTGSGLLQGYWQVDNRLLSHVNQHVMPGKSITIETPEDPFLPTFSDGTHVVKFVITSPEQDIVLPKAIYYVTDPAEKLFSISLEQPDDMTNVLYSETFFKWNTEHEVTSFLIEFIDDNGEKPVFSAFTEEYEYLLPSSVVKYYFSPNKSYFWSVKALDETHEIIGKSPLWEIRLK